MAESVLSAALSVPATLRARAATGVVYLQGVGSGQGEGVRKGEVADGRMITLGPWTLPELDLRKARDSIHDMDNGSVMKGTIVTDQKGTTVAVINSWIKVFQDQTSFSMKSSIPVPIVLHLYRSEY